MSDSKQLPFSNGKGGPASVPGRAPPNNFLTNPRGNNSGAGTKGVQQASASRQQQPLSKDPELNTESMPAGGPDPILPDISPQRASEASITATSSKKPFKLGG